MAPSAKYRNASTNVRLAIARIRQNYSTPPLLLRCTFVAGNEHEFLDALGVIDLARVQVSVRIRGDLVHPVKLSGIAAAMPSLAQNISVVALENPQNVVFSVSH